MIRFVSLGRVRTAFAVLAVQVLATSAFAQDRQNIQSLVATVFGEPLYFEAITPAEAEVKRKELPLAAFEKWLIDSQSARLYDFVWAAVRTRYIEREKIGISDEDFTALEKFVARQMISARGLPDESPFPSSEYKGIAVALARASLIDWKVCKSLYEQHGGRVGIGSLGAWTALDGQHRLLCDHFKRHDFQFHNEEIELAFWRYSTRTNFADAYPAGEELNRLLATPPYLRAEIAGGFVQAQRERIGSALGRDVYRDQLQENPPSYHQVVQLFMAPAMEEFEREKWTLVEMTDDEICAGVAWMEAEARKQGGARWEQWQTQSEELKASVDRRVAEIKGQLDHPATSENERLMLQTALRVTSLESTHPHAGEVWFTMRRRKFEYYLNCNYGGGRIIYQQFGPEALDARRKLLLKLEQAGKFQITDPALRKLAYEYWERPSHPGGFHTDHRLLMFPWTKDYQEMVNEQEGSDQAKTK